MGNTKNRLQQGQKFGGWTIIGHARKVGGSRVNHFYLCRCICGIEREVVEHALKEGRTKSCGCLKGHYISTNKKVHGASNTRLFNVWRSMKQRCYYDKHVAYKNYGGRGIKICNEWLNNTSLFFEWARTHGYKDNLDIDRINNNGNYEPNNCRFVTKKENANNRRNKSEDDKRRQIELLDKVRPMAIKARWGNRNSTYA